MASPLKGALVGFGQVAEHAHVKSFLGDLGFQIVAVAEESAPRRGAARAVLPHARLYPSLDELLQKESSLDFIDIATPPFLHGQQVLRALDHGCHVLCEKPLTLDRAEFEAIEKRSASSGKAVFTVHNWAYSPQWAKALELVSSGVLGRISHAELHVLRTKPAASAVPGDWRMDARLSGGGILVDHGWHALYLLHRLLGAPAKHLRAALDASGPRAVEDQATVFLDFGSATALLHLTWRAAERSNWAVLYGGRGTLELRDDVLLLKLGSGPERRFAFPEKLSAGSAHPEWFSAMLADFRAEAAAFRRGANLREARFCLESILAAYGDAGASSSNSRRRTLTGAVRI